VLVLLIAIALALAVVGFVWLTYNRMVARRNAVDNSWSQIAVELKRRHDLFTGAFINSSFDGTAFSSGFAFQVAPPASSSTGGGGGFSGGGGGGSW
jgi:uncharacterized membrane protein